MKRSLVRAVGLLGVVAAGIGVFGSARAASFEDLYEMPEAEVRRLVHEEVRRYQVRPPGALETLVLCVIEAESARRPAAVSRAGAVGLMQVLPSTAKKVLRVSREELFDPRANVAAGTTYLVGLLGRYGGDVVAALRHYNGGTAAADGHPPRETREYVRRVLTCFERQQGSLARR